MTLLKVIYDTNNQIIKLCPTVPLNLELAPDLLYVIYRIIYVNKNQQGILKVSIISGSIYKQIHQTPVI